MEGNVTDFPPRRGQIWDIQLNPTKGVEIAKIRPCIVVSYDKMSGVYRYGLWCLYKMAGFVRYEVQWGREDD